MRKAIGTRTISAECKRARETGKALYIWDTELKGFGAYVTSKGEVSWLVQRWIGGKGGRPVRSVIERSPPMSLDKARKQAQIELGEIRKGVDIVDRRRRERQALNAEINGDRLLEVFERYHKRNSKPGRYWLEIDHAFKRHIIPTLGEKTLVSRITKPDVRRLLDAKEDIGELGAAQKRFALLNPFFKWCVQREIITSSPMQGMVAPGQGDARDRTLTTAEIKALWSATQSMTYPYQQLYRLLLLTGQRREEGASIEWKELDLDKATWTIPSSKTKNGKPHIVHLSTQTLAVIATLERKHGVPYLLTTTGKTPVSGFAKGKKRLDSFMQPETPWIVHDLRRTIVSHLAELGISTDVADRILNHVSGSQAGVKGVYQRYEFLAERKRAMEAWGSYVEQLTSGKALSNVVQLKA